MSAEGSWRLDGAVARLEDHFLQAELPINEPAAGMHVSAVGLDAPIGRLWAWTAMNGEPGSRKLGPPSCLDAYVRGSDLVLTYGETPGCPFETQLYWRHERPLSAGGSRLSLVVSIRTQSLDTSPTVEVASRWEAGAPLVASSRSPLAFDGIKETDSESDRDVVVVKRSPDSGPSIVEACHPDDQTLLTHDGDAFRWRLFSHFLEKGVIRRARLTAAFAPAASIEAAAGEVCDGMLNEPLPLTT